ncbi:MAG TPA: glycosyltransferase family 4 protein [Candidatus Gastranaerophilales bacterium]|nr:glycosyltransferase family 4 protein [Candidatus Gastranaerophilales bacterium]
MKKIAFIVRMFQEKSFHGGGEKLFYNLIKRFSQDNFVIDVYCSESNVENPNFVNKINIIKEPYDHNKPETMENFYNKVQEQIKNEIYDHIISENITPPVDITFLQGHSLINRLRKTKNPFESFLYRFRKIKKQRIKYQEKWLKQGYRKIFAVSELLKQDIMDNFDIPENNIKVIYPGVDMPETQDLKTVNSPVIFGLLAPGFKIKGGYIFLNALKILKQKGYKFKARIIYPKFKGNLGVKLLVSLNNLSESIDFISYQKDIFAFYRSLDCLVVPSLEDTFNLAALEAMSVAKPCIVSKNAGVSEIINDNINGFTFEINRKSSENLAEKMMFYIDNPDLRSGLSQSAFKTAEKYSWDKVYEEFSHELSMLSIKKICK